LVERQVGDRVGGGEVVIATAGMAGASGLLAATPAGRRGRPGWRRRPAGRARAGIVRRVGQGIGDVRGFATAAVETLFEQADFGFEFVEALLALAVTLLQAGVAVALALGQLLFEFGFAEDSALVEGLVEADLLPSVTEELLAGGQATGY